VKWVRTFLWMVVFLVIILFAVQNKDEVTLRFGLYPLPSSSWHEISRIPIFLPIVLAFLLGVLIAGLSDACRRYQMKRMLRQNQKTIERLEQEILAIRSPISDKPYPSKQDR